jgi:mannose-6-phosphate isomerase-like protein (cupin superfamily)
MSAVVQSFRFDETVSPSRGGVSVRGRGVNGQDGGTVQASMYPFDPGIPGLNIRFSYDRVRDGFFSPRHHHNFDQFRYVLSGSINIGKNNDLREGECGYFPEGTFYGPQDQKGEGVQLVMQFPGPEAAYYMLGAESRAAAEKLVARGGVFENGAFRGTGPDGRPLNKDGFEAVWEAHNEQPVRYADQRYTDPVMMKTGAFKWLPDPRREGVDVKYLGTFNEYRTSLAEWRLKPGTVLPGERLDAPEFRFILRGEVIYAGKELPAHSCLYIPDGVETEPLESRAGAELLLISVPMYVRAVWDRAREARAATALAR